MFSLNCKGKILALTNPLVMGILNVTPDSFFEGHLNKLDGEILSLAEKMINDGADIIDVGGQSTRPGSMRVSAENELERVIPVIRLLARHFPDIIISIDTYYSMVASAAVDQGASIVNDISGGRKDDTMIRTVGSLHVPYICMHMKGSPETMHINPEYDDIVKELLDFFIIKTVECREAGIMDVIIDPGFGFGKTINQNFQLLHQLATFKMLDKPILAGLSRKSTIYKTLNTNADGALNGTTVLNTLALQNGADILRVHDVKEAKEAILLMMAYKAQLITQE